MQTQRTKEKKEHKFLRFCKEWTLIISMVLGAIGFFMLKYIDILAPLRHPASALSHGIMPYLIFAMLFITFSKVNLKQYCVKSWYFYAVLIQLALVFGTVWTVSLFPTWDGRFALEGGMICLIAPTATAAAVIVKKLGGQVPTITTYTLISGFVTAVVVPLVLPLLPSQDLQMDSSFSFLALFGVLISKVFPLLILPFIATLILREVAPKLNEYVATKSKDLAFYLWGFALVINIAQTIHAIDSCHIDLHHILMIAMAGLVACLLQFAIGRLTGHACHDTISCGQGMGQKNTIISIWVSLTYMNPITAVGPGSYVLWQNIINSAQLIHKSKEERV